MIALLRSTEPKRDLLLDSNHLCKGYDAASLLSHMLSQIANIWLKMQQPFLSIEQIEQITAADTPLVPAPMLNDLFHLDTPPIRLPQFARRLLGFKATLGL